MDDSVIFPGHREPVRQVYRPGHREPATPVLRPGHREANALVGVANVARAKGGTSRRSSGSGWSPGEPQVVATALDRPFSLPGEGCATTLRALFAALRAAGVEPHPRGEGEDLTAAEEIYGAYRQSAAADATGAGLMPSPLIGLAEGMFARTYPSTTEGLVPPKCENPPNCRERLVEEFQEQLRAQTGTWAQQAAEMAALGAGRVRKLRQCDVFYAALFPLDEWDGAFFHYGKLVPPPALLLSGMEEGAYARLSATTQLLVLCLGLGVKLDLTPFNGGGGVLLNVTSADNTHESEAVLGLSSFDDSGVLIRSLKVAQPEWQTGMLIQSGEGWDPFYWDHTAFPASTTKPVGGERIYHQYVLNVWPTTDTAEKTGRAAYASEARRRKCLGVAAFTTGIGRWLGAIDRALSSLGCGTRVLDVVDTIELGNELDGYWQTDAETGEATNAAYEVGRYFALLAGPIHREVPGMKFRHDLHDWARNLDTDEENFEEKLAWKYEVLSLGLCAETEWWRAIQLGELLEELRSRGYHGAGLSEDASRWLATCEAAGFRWPPSLVEGIVGGLAYVSTAALRELLVDADTVEAGELFHQVGMHWYHNWNRENDGDPSDEGYEATNRLAADLGRLAELAASLASFGFDLTTTIGEIAWQAHDPGDPLGHDLVEVPNDDPLWSGNYSFDTTPLFQAAMYLRLLATCLAGGAATAKLYTFNYGATPASEGWYPERWGQYVFHQTTDWGAYATVGVRNDATTEPEGGYGMDRDLWPRPSWFAFQRLVWLLARAGNTRQSTVPAGVSMAYDAEGCQVVEIAFAQLLDVDPEGQPLEGRWARAYLVWLDQTSVAETIDLRFRDEARGWFELLPVVPDVVPQTEPEGQSGDWATDVNGYATLSERVSPNPEWRWSGVAARGGAPTFGWDAALAGVTPPRSGGARRYFTLTVRRADASGGKFHERAVLAPLCVLTNAVFDPPDSK